MGSRRPNPPLPRVCKSLRLAAHHWKVRVLLPVSVTATVVLAGSTVRLPVFRNTAESRVASPTSVDWRGERKLVGGFALRRLV